MRIGVDKMKYESGENFKSMAYRYRVVLSLLNYDDVSVETPKLGSQLVVKLRQGIYSEATERLLVLFSYGMIDEHLLNFLTQVKILSCSDAEAAENLVLMLENNETKKKDKYVEIDADMLDLNAFHNALTMCAETSNSDSFDDVGFDKAYEVCSAKHTHIKIEDGFCIPDDYLYNFALSFDDVLISYSKEKNSVETMEEKVELSMNNSEQIVFKNVQTAVFIEYYIERLFGRDYITYTIENNLPMEISEDKYRVYLNDKKLSFEFKKLTRKHWYLTSKYNYLDYSVVNTTNGEFVSIAEPSAEIVTLRIDANDVNSNDTPKDIIEKLIRKETYDFPDVGTIMQTTYDNTPIIFVFSNGNYTEINYKQFYTNLVDYERILSLAKFFSDKHLIRWLDDNNVNIIATKDGINYKELKEITDIEFEAVKGVIREQLARRFALERKKTENLRKMSQLKIEAEALKRKEAADAAQKEENRQQEHKEETAKRANRKTNGQ